MADPRPLSREEYAASRLQHHFVSMEQQRDASTLAMWVFLVTEVMFFGGLFRFVLAPRLERSRKQWQSGRQD